MAKFPAYFGQLDSYPDLDVKKKFLSSGSRMFRRVGKGLVDEGLLVDAAADYNESGIAGSGDVYGTFWLSETQAVHLHMSASGFASSGRKDRISVMAQYREVPDDGRPIRNKSQKRPHPSRILGSNVWMNVSEISDETIKVFVKKCVSSHPAMDARTKSIVESEKLMKNAGLEPQDNKAPRPGL